MKCDPRDSLVTSDGNTQTVEVAPSCDGLSCRGTVGEGGGRGTICVANSRDVVAWCGHMNTRSRDIAQLMLTFSSSCDAQLCCQLHRRVRAPHDPATVRYTLCASASLNLRFAASCHIQHDFPLEIGISELPLHHLHIRLGVHVTLPDIECFWKIPHLIHEITAVDMGMHDQVVSCHPLD